MEPFKADQAFQNRIHFPRYFCFILKAVILILLFRMVPPMIAMAAASPAEVKIHCNIHTGVCSQNLAGLTITLDISPKPVRAMQDLVFRVTLAGESLEQTPFIDLGMPGMKMGPNRVILKKITGPVYEGKGVIVRCPSGSRTWQATVTVPGKGKADFVFDVVY